MDWLPVYSTILYINRDLWNSSDEGEGCELTLATTMLRTCVPCSRSNLTFSNRRYSLNCGLTWQPHVFNVLNCRPDNGSLRELQVSKVVNWFKKLQKAKQLLFGTCRVLFVSFVWKTMADRRDGLFFGMEKSSESATTVAAHMAQETNGAVTRPQ